MALSLKILPTLKYINLLQINKVNMILRTMLESLEQYKGTVGCFLQNIITGNECCIKHISRETKLASMISKHPLQLFHRAKYIFQHSPKKSMAIVFWMSNVVQHVNFMPHDKTGETVTSRGPPEGLRNIFIAGDYEIYAKMSSGCKKTLRLTRTIGQKIVCNVQLATSKM